MRYSGAMGSMETRTIVLFNGDGEDRDRCAAALRRAGYAVEPADDPRALRPLLRSTPSPALLIVDVPAAVMGARLLVDLRGEGLLQMPVLLCAPGNVQTLEMLTRGSHVKIMLKQPDPEPLLRNVAQLIGQPAGAAGGQAAVVPGKGHRVLVVDDDRLTLQIIMDQLVAKGFTVHAAHSADEAIQLILQKETRPELVLLDFNMPEVDGAQLCRFLKSSDLFAGIKVLLCSAVPAAELEAICHDCGADGFVCKGEFIDSSVLARLTGGGA